MKITKLETIWLKTQPKLVFLRVHTDEGLIGTGETYDTPAAVEAYVHSDMAAYLLGKDPLQIDRHWNHLFRLPRLALGKTLEIRALSALDLALWDLLGKVSRQPVYQLLGGATRDRIRVYNTCAGYAYVGDSGEGYHATAGGSARADRPYEDMYAFLHHADRLAESLLSEGYRQMKIWPFDQIAEASGGRYISLEELRMGFEPLRKIRAAVGEQMEIALELHNLWNLPSAIRIAKAAADYGVVWCEDPIPMDDLDALADLRRQANVPICASETLGTRWGFRGLFEKHAVDIAMLDMTWCGGLGEAKRIATMAEVFSLPVAPHDCVGPVTFMADVHLCMNLPNALVQEVVRAFVHGWYRDLVTELPVVKDGYVHLPQGHGLGTEIRPQVFDRSDVVVKVTERG
ncbi:MAG TPA: mandelate racemase/muconate lactonizing enzyme family protein [Xanthobacteraceae bacterium]|nr:mandelate racemase/muconate lactonizing enzyme family protein [Xanthobacteraceae bacterium]